MLPFGVAQVSHSLMIRRRGSPITHQLDKAGGGIAEIGLRAAQSGSLGDSSGFRWWVGVFAGFSLGVRSTTSFLQRLESREQA